MPHESSEYGRKPPKTLSLAGSIRGISWMLGGLWDAEGPQRAPAVRFCGPLDAGNWPPDNARREPFWPADPAEQSRTHAGSQGLATCGEGASLILRRVAFV